MLYFIEKAIYQNSSKLSPDAVSFLLYEFQLPFWHSMSLTSRLLVVQHLVREFEKCGPPLTIKPKPQPPPLPHPPQTPHPSEINYKKRKFLTVEEEVDSWFA